MLEIRNLTKRYNRIPAITGVTFTVRRGEILGYLGPNGAGKSTTVKILTGLIEPAEGEILFDGEDIRTNMPAFLRRVGYVPEEAHIYPHLAGREYLQLAGRIRGMHRRLLEPRADELLRVFGLWEDRHSPLSSYSKGMRQKVLLSAALLHNPEVLILDEPFSGLDVSTAMVLRSLLSVFADAGKLILYSSHVLEVVEKVCNRVVILHKGSVVAYDAVENLRTLMAENSLEGVFAQLTAQEDPDARARGILEIIQA